MDLSEQVLFVGVICLILMLYLILLQVSYLVMFAYISLTLGDTLHPSFFYISSKVLSEPQYQAIFPPLQFLYFFFLYLSSSLILH